MSKKFSQMSFEVVKNHFNGDVQRTFAWFNTENNLLSGKKPIDMIKSGKSDKLLDIIKNALYFDKL